MMGTWWLGLIRPNRVQSVRYQREHRPWPRTRHCRLEVVLLEDRCLPSTVSGQVFNDLNGNSIQETGEPGLPGVTLFLDANHNSALDPGETRTTSDASGSYRFVNLPAGTYRARDVVPTGFVRTSVHPADIVVSTNSTVTDVNFGHLNVAPTNRISGRAFNDLNYNGTQETGEPGLLAVTLFVDANNNGGLDTSERRTTTDAGGNYSFANLPGGTYRVREVIPTGFVQTTVNPADLVVSSGGAVTGVNFGNLNITPTNRISGRAFYDVNYNGTWDSGEPGVPGATLFLDTNHNGVLDTSESRTATDASGEYSFANLPGGIYRVRAATGAGQTTVDPADLVVSSGSTVSGVNFGYPPALPLPGPPMFDISGRAFHDFNLNGTWDSGEPGLPGVTLFLDTNNNSVLDPSEGSTTTDASGNYSFAILGYGTIRVREVVPPGFRLTVANLAVIVVSSSVTNVNFGNASTVPTNRISGRAFHDLNRNRTQDPGEPGLSGVTLFLDSNNNGVLNPGETSTVADDSGDYSFANLAVGTYPVREIVPAGFVTTTANPVSIAVSSSTTLPGVNFGNYNIATMNRISGSAFHDLNFNGIQNTGEPSLSGVTLFLDADNNGVLDAGEASTTTDASGNYLFANLASGSYRVRAVILAGSVPTTPNPAIVIVFGGSTASSVNFGNFSIPPTNRISGQIFNDLNNNGSKETGEPGLPGLTLFLDSNNNGVLDPDETRTTTDASGTYSFANLALGAHRVREVMPPGFVLTRASPPVLMFGSSSTITGVDFGNFNIATTNRISGRAFNDLHVIGTEDSGDPGLPGVTLFLDANNNGVLDPGETRTTTDASGTYSFANLAAGTYRVHEVVPPGFVPTTANPAVIVVSSGRTVTGAHFGNFNIAATNRITGRAFNDLNRNETLDSGEPGLSGLTLFLDSNDTGVLDPGETRTTTDSTGNYFFINLATGTYRVREVVPTGFVPTTANPVVVVVSTGNPMTGVNFGNLNIAPTNRLTGRAFNDLNGNGLQDSGEPGLPGPTLFLDSSNNGMLDPGETRTTTDASGTYSFANLPGNTYRVREVIPTGWLQTTVNPADLVISSGSTRSGVTFGNLRITPSERISGRAFHDYNGNRIQDSGDPGLPDVTIFLDTNNNGVPDPDETRTTTDASGNYRFTDLAFGSYRVRELVPAGYVAITDNPVGILVSTSVSQATGVNFGNYSLTPTNRLSGRAFHDLNLNRTQDPGEAGLPGVILFLDTNNNSVLDTDETNTTTDASGNYSFANLAAGYQRVREVVPTGWVATNTNPPVIVSSRSTVTGVNFGNYSITPTNRISGRVFHDLNRSGTQDSGELGLPGVNVFLDSNNNGRFDLSDTSSTTDASGTYSFVHLPVGIYQVRETVPAGFVPTTANPVLLVVSSGTTLSGVAFGNYSLTAPNRLSGQAFHDLNANGLQDSGEPGLPGVLLFLDGNDNSVLDPGETRTTSDNSGNYSFTNLAAGTYRVREGLPKGFVLTTASPAAIVLGSGSTVTGVTFGHFSIAAVPAPSNLISGAAFHDLNSNGNRDSGEPGLLGLTVFLDTNNNGVLEPGETRTTTDRTGTYLFANLASGTYRVRAVVSAGWVPTTAHPAVIVVGSSINNVTGVNFGTLSSAPTNHISGRAFNDRNSNGTLDIGEPGLSGVTLFLDSNNNGGLDPGETSTITEGGGSYRFASLAAGIYRVRAVVPAGLVPTTANPAVIVVSGDTTVTGVNFGNFRSGASGSPDELILPRDSNNPGTLDTGETRTPTDASTNPGASGNPGFPSQPVSDVRPRLVDEVFGNRSPPPQTDALAGFWNADALCDDDLAVLWETAERNQKT